jgi:hypothetical protein
MEETQMNKAKFVIGDIAAINKFPSFPYPKRVSVSDSNLYSWAVVPVLDDQDDDYNVELKVRAADPDIEEQLAQYIMRAVNLVPLVLDQLEFALIKLDSVAFLQKEGDTSAVKNALRDAIEKLKGLD